MLISIKKQAPQYGIEVVGEVLCEPKSKDLTIQASTLRDINPNAVISTDYMLKQGRGLELIRTIGWNPYTIMSVGRPLLLLLGRIT